MTIFALSTPPGKSGVAVIRISGNNAVNALVALGYKAVPTPRLATLAKLSSPDTNMLIDEVLFIYFKAPSSFTGEDIVEIHCHGSRAVISAISMVLLTLPGFRLAEAGEFSRRAFMHGKMDLTRAEGIADLIDAETSAQQRQALRQMSGELETLYENWRSQLIHVLAYIEAYIDFPDEDLPPSVIEEITIEVAALREAMSAHLADNRRGEKIRDGLTITIIGAPNAGKSSLLNWLAKRDVAIVSQVAGTTRDIIEVHLDVGGYAVVVSDTAGLRDSHDEIESEGIRRAIERARSADLKIAVYDATQNDIDEATQVLIDKNTIIIANKIDLPGAKSLGNAMPVSVKTGQGGQALLSYIEKVASEMLGTSESPIISRARHRQHLLNCANQLQLFDLYKDIELSAEDLRRAAVHLGQITGRIDIEMVLDEIFSAFCIGK